MIRGGGMRRGRDMIDLIEYRVKILVSSKALVASYVRKESVALFISYTISLRHSLFGFISRSCLP